MIVSWHNAEPVTTEH